MMYVFRGPYSIYAIKSDIVIRGRGYQCFVCPEN